MKMIKYNFKTESTNETLHNDDYQTLTVNNIRFFEFS